MLPFQKFSTLPALLQFFLQIPFAVFGDVLAGKDIRKGNPQGDTENDECRIDSVGKGIGNFADNPVHIDKRQ